MKTVEEGIGGLILCLLLVETNIWGGDGGVMLMGSWGCWWVQLTVQPQGLEGFGHIGSL